MTSARKHKSQADIKRLRFESGMTKLGEAEDAANTLAQWTIHRQSESLSERKKTRGRWILKRINSRKKHFT